MKMKDLDIRLGDLFRIKKEFLLQNLVPKNSGIEENLSIGILTRIQLPDGSDEHKSIVLNNTSDYEDASLDDIMEESMYKIMFMRIDKTYWFPEYKFIQMFTPLVSKRK
jgi:hypothetical protein